MLSILDFSAIENKPRFGVVTRRHDKQKSHGENCPRQSPGGRSEIPYRAMRSFNGCEVRIENSVTRVTVQHQEAGRVMPKNYPEWWNFPFAPKSHYGFFFLYIRFLLRLYLRLKMRYFINFTLQCAHFLSRNCQFGFYLRHPDIMHKVILHPSYKMEVFRTGENRGKLCKKDRVWANSANPDQTAPEEDPDQNADLGLHCLPRSVCLNI